MGITYDIRKSRKLITIIEKTLEQNNIYALFNHLRYDTCSSCNGPEGWESSDIIYLQESLYFSDGPPNDILVNYEWTHPLSEETFTWCCCYIYNAPKPKMLPASSIHAITSIVEDEECSGTPCEECTSSDCTIELPAPGNVVSFTTTSAPDGIVDSITTTEIYSDGWNGMVMSIINVLTGAVEATYTGPPAGSTSQTEPALTLLPSTEYGIYIDVKGVYDDENGITIFQDGVNLLTIAPFNKGFTADCTWYTSEGEEEGGGEGGGEGEGEGEGVLGCTDPAANNYNEDATEDDGSCTYDGE